MFKEAKETHAAAQTPGETWTNPKQETGEEVPPASGYIIFKDSVFLQM